MISHNQEFETASELSGPQITGACGRLISPCIRCAVSRIPVHSAHTQSASLKTNLHHYFRRWCTLQTTISEAHGVGRTEMKNQADLSTKHMHDTN